MRVKRPEGVETRKHILAGQPLTGRIRHLSAPGIEIRVVLDRSIGSGVPTLEPVISDFRQVSGNKH
jgi:hypothetical protein